MQRRKERIANAKKSARLASKLRHRRQLQALLGLFVIAVLVTAGALWQTGFFDRDTAEDPDVTDADFLDDPDFDFEDLDLDGFGDEPVEGEGEDDADTQNDE
jgi:hypothetical protein